MYYFLVTLCRSIFAFGLVLLWMAMPALACLPNAAMTQVEMACCKKMAGDCHMGAVSTLAARQTSSVQRLLRR